jgi:TRAP-type C4-dicarboxylate transport system permease small subunit
MRLLVKANTLLNRGLLVVAGVAVVGLLLLETGNVVTRLAGRPFQGAFELAGLFGAVAIALALGSTQLRGDHVMVDLFTRRLPKPLLRALDGLRHLVSAVFFALMAWQVWAIGARMTETGEVSETLKADYHLVVYAVALGLAVLAVTLLLDALRQALPERGETA